MFLQESIFVRKCLCCTEIAVRHMFICVFVKKGLGCVAQPRLCAEIAVGRGFIYVFDRFYVFVIVPLFVVGLPKLPPATDFFTFLRAKYLRWS